MLDVADFVTDRGGDPNKIKESQRRRFASEDAVDEVIVLYEDARKGERPLETPCLLRPNHLCHCSAI